MAAQAPAETSVSTAPLNKQGAGNQNSAGPIAVIFGPFKGALAVAVTLVTVEDLAFKEIGAKVAPQILGASFPNQIGNPHKGGRRLLGLNNVSNAMEEDIRISMSA